MAREQIRLDTTYQVAALKLSNGTTAHRISVTAMSGGAVRIEIDPNNCELDAFGSPTACTLMAPMIFEGRLDLIDERQGEWLFSVEAGESPLLHLVLRSFGNIQSARLLVLSAKGDIRAVVALSPVG